MLDILHYYFEVDIVGEEEVQKAKARMRKQIYTTMYNRRYTWMSDSSDDREFGTQEVGATAAQGQPQLEHKYFTPSTPFDPTASRPYGSLLDAPLE